MRAEWGRVNDQIVELNNPGLQILLYSPGSLRELEDGCDYGRKFPDGKDLVDYINECRIGAIGTRWPRQDYWLHFSSTMDQSVISRASDHARLGVLVTDGQLCVRGGDDLFKWRPRCPEEQLITMADGVYNVTACMLPFGGDGPVRIYLHFAEAPARPDLGYADVPELFCEAPVY
jgi:hypothetical protein